MRPISSNREEDMSSRILRFAGVVILIAGGSVFGVFSAVPMYEWYGAQSWPAVPCTILESAVRTHASEDGIRYSADILYAYEWKGARYEGDRYNFFDVDSGDIEDKQSRVDQYPPGETRTCFVNPDDPEYSVLSVAFSQVYIIGCIGLIFVVFALFLIFYRRRASGTGVPAAVRTAAAPRRGAAAAAETAPEYGTITLKGDKNSLIGLITLVVLALLWNGVIVASLFRHVNFGGRGVVDVFALLFLVPFVLVGLALIGGAGFFLLKLLNPHPDLTLAPGHLPLGGSAVLGWSFRGNAGRIRKLTVTLQGVESATYRRGTSTTTDKSIFESVALLETESLPEIRRGEIPVAVPEFSVPSFSAPNSKIRWYFKVHGEIGFWPDLSEEFEFAVAPLPVGAAALAAPVFEVAEQGGSPAGVELQLRNDPGALVPGEVLEGSVGWGLDSAPSSAVLRLFWYSAGRGSMDVEIVEELTLPAHRAEICGDFRIPLPNAPYSFRGQLVSLRWAMELVIDRGKHVKRIDLTVSPWVEQVTLPKVG